MQVVYGLRSRRLGKLIARTTALTNAKFLKFEIESRYCPIFSGLFGEEAKTKAEVIELCVLDAPHTFRVLGRIVLSDYRLDEICPHALIIQDNESMSSIQENEESDRSASPSASDSESSRHDSDDEYYEPTWIDMVDNCPDEFEVVRNTYRMILSPDRAKHILVLKSITLFPPAAKRKKKRLVQSSAGNIQVKNEKR